MKVGKLAVNLVKWNVTHHNAKKYALVTPEAKYRPNLDIPYIDDGDHRHMFNLFYAPNRKKKVLVIDIHGGAYIFGKREENYQFGTVFLDAGFDFIATDYIPNDGNRSVRLIIEESVQCVAYILTHMKELGLSDDYQIILTGDSAGGHLALSVAEIFLDKKYAAQLGFNDLPKINLKGVLVNCPVFDFIPLGKSILNKRGVKRLFGDDANDDTKRALIDPKTHIESLTVPLFCSTCINDFLRVTESLELQRVMKDRPNKFVFIDLQTKDKDVGHVHNILDISHPESVKVNQIMIDFINDLTD